MLWVSFIVMAVGLIGLIFCAKKQKTNPAMQPLAVGCLLVVLAGFGIYLYQQNSPQDFAEDDLLFETSTVIKAGKCLLANDSNAKILYVIAPTSMGTKASKDLKERTEKALGTTIEMVSPETDTPNEYIPEIHFKTTEFDKLLKAHPDCNAVICAIGLPADIKVSSPVFEKRTMVLLNASPILFHNKILPRLAKDGKVIGVVTYKANFDIDKTADSGDMEATFNTRYELMDKAAIANKK